MSGLSLSLLGPPQIELDGRPVTIRRSKVLALLAYLAVTGETQRRDTLATLLWPDSGQRQARMALNRHLSELKKILGGGWIDSDRETVELRDSARLWSDVRQFQQALADCPDASATCMTKLTAAASLYRDDFLTGFTLSDCPEFDDWQSFQAEGLRRQLATLLDRLVQGHYAQGDYEAAIMQARRRLALDPLHEAAHQTLMQLYAAKGEQASALRQYQTCVDLLEAELGVPPAEATTTLYEHIRSGLPLHPPKGGSNNQDSPLWGARGDVIPQTNILALLTTEPSNDSPPLVVARERELARLDQFLQAMLSGQGSVVFVTGEAGRGKTTLVEAFVREAQKEPDLLAVTGVCNALTGVGDPYLPFREILQLLSGDITPPWAGGTASRESIRRLRQAAPGAIQTLMSRGPDLIDVFVPGSNLLEQAKTIGPAPWLSDLEALVKRKQAQGRDGLLRQQDLFNQVSRVLQTLAQHQPLLLILDDLHWADAGSINLLFHVGRQLEGQRILIVGTYRPADVALPRAGERHPLEAVVNEFQRHWGNNQLDLKLAEGRQLVEALIDSEPNHLGADFREALFQHTGGHALFTVETLKDMQARGSLVQDEGGFWVEGPIDWSQLPARVEGVIAERIGRLPEPLQETLQVACIEGERFTAEVVASVLGLPPHQVLRQLSRALAGQHHLVRNQGSLRVGDQRLSPFRFEHSLFQTYVYQRLNEAERTYLHEAVGTVLETIYASQTALVAEQLAQHFVEAGVIDTAITYLHQAGLRATRLLAYDEGLAHYNRALKLLETLPETDERNRQELLLQVDLGDLLITAKGPASVEVEQTFERAYHLFQQVEESPCYDRLFYGLCASYRYRGQILLARQIAEVFIQAVQDEADQAIALVAHAILGNILFYMGEQRLGHIQVEQSLALYQSQQHNREVFTTVSDPRITMQILLGRALWMLGYPDQALVVTQDSVAIARAATHPYSEIVTVSNLALLHQFRREPDSIQQQVAALSNLVEDSGISWLSPLSDIVEGWAFVMQGQAEVGINRIRQALAERDESHVINKQSYGLALLAEGYLRLGQSKEGLQYIAEALAMVEETGERWWEAELYRLKGQLHLQRGDSEAEVEACFQRAIEIARRQGARILELRATVSLSRLWQAQGKSAVAQAILREIYDWFTEGFDTPDLIEAKILLDELARA